MAQFVAFNSEVDVNGETVLAIVDGMGSFKERAFSILKESGIDKPKPGAWYRQQFWLDAFKKISDAIGAYTLFNIGKKIPENANFPPEIDNIEKALSGIDIAYHMNHSIGKEAMFNPANGVMKEGIGHYGYEKKDDRTVIMMCNNPYPCDFDRGIIESMANKFKPQGVSMIIVSHDDTKPCRKKGADSCTYIVKW